MAAVMGMALSLLRPAAAQPETCLCTCGARPQPPLRPRQFGGGGRGGRCLKSQPRTRPFCGGGGAAERPSGRRHSTARPERGGGAPARRGVIRGGVCCDPGVDGI